MLEDLSLKLETALKKVRGQGKLTEKNISDTLREIRRVLLNADVNYKVAKDFIANVSAKALGTEVLSSISPGQLITKIIYDELTELLGGDHKELKLNASGITTIMIVGLQGSGKTTFADKLARKLKGQKRKLLLTAADVYRPAAIEQLKLLGTQIDVPVFSLEEPDAVKVVKNALDFVTNEGGITSHASILAREFGIPCIVGTRTATEMIKTGDTINVNANNGTINIIKKKK